MTRFRFPEPDPNMTPLPADFRARVMNDLRARARKRAWVRAAKVAAALLIVTISIYLGIRTAAPAPPLHPEIVKQMPAPRPAPPSHEEAVPIPRNEVTSTVPRAEVAYEPRTKPQSDVPGIFVLHETRNGKEELVLMVHGKPIRDRKTALALLENEPCCEVPVQEVRKGKRVTVMIQAGKCRK